MAFSLANRSSLRLNHILVGQVVDLCDFQSKTRIGAARFDGWRDGQGNAVDAPKVIKSMPQDWTMAFSAIVENEDEFVPVTLVKDPAGFGAMFLATTKGEGDDAKTTLRRVTAYATEEAILASREARKPSKAEAAPEVVEAPVEGQTDERPAEEPAPAKQKRGRKGSKAKVEA